MPIFGPGPFLMGTCGTKFFLGVAGIAWRSYLWPREHVFAKKLKYIRIECLILRLEKVVFFKNCHIRRRHRGVENFSAPTSWILIHVYVIIIKKLEMTYKPHAWSSFSPQKMHFSWKRGKIGILTKNTHAHIFQNIWNLGKKFCRHVFIIVGYQITKNEQILRHQLPYPVPLLGTMSLKNCESAWASLKLV